MAGRNEQVIAQIIRAVPNDSYTAISVGIFCDQRFLAVIRVFHRQTQEIYMIASWSLLVGSNMATFRFSKTLADGKYRIDVLQQSKQLSYMDFEIAIPNSNSKH